MTTTDTLNVQHDIDFVPRRTATVHTHTDDPNRGLSDSEMDTVLDMESTDTLARTHRPLEV